VQPGYKKNKDPLMSISPSYILTCTLENGIYFDLKTVAYLPREKLKLLSGRMA
jgi:hypothetical protein